MAPDPSDGGIHTDTMIDNHQQLIDFLTRGARPREDWGIGLEAEKLVIDAETGEAASYPQVRELLQRLDGIGGWQGVYEGDYLIGLQGERSSVTLEPGGQLELSGKFCCDIHCSWRDLKRYRQHILVIGNELGLNFLGLGVQPFTSMEQIGWLPKERYGIMGPYMQRTGDMGQRMMKQTAGTQVNLDFSDEQDCVRKLKAIQLLSPVSYALFANSPIMEGSPTGFVTTRGEIWSRTDADRCGLIRQLFRPQAGLGDFVDYALDVPMYFIQRGGRYLDLTQQRFSFRNYLESGWQGQQATLDDWNLHLSTLFPEVRLRPQLEARSVDSLPPHFTPAVGAFYKGLLYTVEGLAKVESLLGCLSEAEFDQLYRDSWRVGLKAAVPGGTLQELAAELVAAAGESLRQQYADGFSGADESPFLDVLDELIESGETLAERLLKRWSGERSDKLALLKEHCAWGGASALPTV